MDVLFKNLILFSIGGVVYLLVELLWRGYTHFSMFFLGGLCFWLVGFMNEKKLKKIPFVTQMLLGAVIITSLELAFGYILNIKLGLNVWNYADMPFNIMGQICLPYTALWFILSGVCILFDDWLRKYIM